MQTSNQVIAQHFGLTIDRWAAPRPPAPPHPPRMSVQPEFKKCVARITRRELGTTCAAHQPAENVLLCGVFGAAQRRGAAKNHAQVHKATKNFESPRRQNGGKSMPL